VNKYTYIIASPPYEENNGGVIALHKLCATIRTLGRDSYLFPYFPHARYDTEDQLINSRNFHYTAENTKNFLVNPAIPCYVVGVDNLNAIKTRSDIVVVYPEIISGNPLEGKNIVRWLLHDAGFFTGKIYFQRGEIYFLYGRLHQPVYIPGSHMSENPLTVLHIPYEHYNLTGAAEVRTGTAYCIRKGKGKRIQHSLADSILIDGLPHKEVSSIFKRVKQFISYDTRTFYSTLAVLCGCDSIVIPDDGVSEDDWRPDLSSRYGVAYGFSNLEKARMSKKFVAEYLRIEEAKSLSTTENFISEVENYFTKRKAVAT
jgi:hypothetical protein